MRRAMWWTIAGLVIAGGLLPIALYWFALGRIPTLTPIEAQRRLADAPEKMALVDVRTAEEYASGHLTGAINWPLEEISSGGNPPDQLAGREMLLICRSGWRSAKATQHLRNDGQVNVWSVRGGMQEWVTAGLPKCPVGLAMTSPTTRSAALAFRAAPLHEQLAAVITGFGVKPLYMLLTLAVAIYLRKQTATDLVLLRWAMIFFFAGEMACQLNYSIFHDRSYLFEYLHGFGMAVTFALTIAAVFEAIDLRLIGYSDGKKRCAALQICGDCIKYSPVPCGLRRVFLFVIPATIALCFIPLAADFRANSYNTVIFGTRYTYIHEVVHQMYEIRLLPWMAIGLLSASLLALFFERHPVRWSKLLFAAGAGAISFSFFRLFLLTPYVENQVWFAVWEELTELIYVLAVIAILWIFRRAYAES